MIAVLLLLVVLSPVAAQQPQEITPLEKELMYLKAESLVFTATRTVEEIEKSGATVTVYTRQDLQNMGARNLMDVLRITPGFGITRNFVGFSEIEVRGIKTLFSEKILIMMDGHPINIQLTNGGTYYGLGPLDLFNVERIEIIRGPGSALYGANAFLAVINIVSRRPRDVQGITVEGSVGSFDTRRFDLLAGHRFGATSISFNFGYNDTDGIREFVQQDNPLSPIRSGYTLDFEKRYRSDLSLQKGDLELRAIYGLRESGPFVGVANALNDETKQHYEALLLDARYTYAHEKLTLKPRLYYDQSLFSNFWEIFSEGFLGLYPEGMLLFSGIRNEKVGGEIVADREGNSHRFVFGGIAEHQRQYGLRAKQNYDANTFAPLPGGFQDVVDREDQVWGKDGADRYIAGVFGEDVWDLTQNLRLILGARLDYYSDVGSSFNPRVSFMWNFHKGYDLRLLYGSAFRDPTFAELYNKNNPSLNGNPNLNPEKIQTYEIGFSAHPVENFNGRVTVFMNQIDDLIVAANPSVNAGKANSRGLEMEARYVFSPRFSLGGNYVIQSTEDELTGKSLADTPGHRAAILAHFNMAKGVNLWSAYTYKGKTPRQPGDPRPEPSRYGLTDLTLTWENPFDTEGLLFRWSVRNLFSTKFVDPSPAGTMLSDYPREGINFFFSAGYSF